MNSICEDIKDMLEDEEVLNLTFATNLFIMQSPAVPLDIVTIYDTSAGNPDMTLNGDTTIYNNSFQILIRNQEYDDAYALAQAIVDYLNGKANEIWNNTYYMLISLSSGPSQLAGSGGVSILQSGKRRGQVELSINFRVKRQKSS